MTAPSVLRRTFDFFSGGFGVIWWKNLKEFMGESAALANLRCEKKCWFPQVLDIAAESWPVVSWLTRFCFAFPTFNVRFTFQLLDF